MMAREKASGLQVSLLPDGDSASLRESGLELLFLIAITLQTPTYNSCTISYYSDTWMKLVYMLFPGFLHYSCLNHEKGLRRAGSKKVNREIKRVAFNHGGIRAAEIKKPGCGSHKLP